jgi:hypothetical protein
MAQTGIHIGDFSIVCGGSGPQTCSGHLIVGDHPSDSAFYIGFISDETDPEFQLNHVTVVGTTGHFPKPVRFAGDDDGNLIDYTQVSPMPTSVRTDGVFVLKTERLDTRAHKQNGAVSTLTVHYKGNNMGPTNVLTPRPNP